MNDIESSNWPSPFGSESKAAATIVGIAGAWAAQTFLLGAPSLERADL